jgi:lipoprotein-anchoring transpeptidase ErfK/SrfK
MKSPTIINRRQFLGAAALGLGAISLNRFHISKWPQDDTQLSSHLGRVCFGPVEVKTRPAENAKTVSLLYEDAIVAALQEVVGESRPYHRSRRWLETPDGFIWSPLVQPVKNISNPDTTAYAKAKANDGFWAEVTLPVVDAILINANPYSYWYRNRLEHQLPYYFYYSQVFWIDGQKQGDDGVEYVRVNDKFGSPGDVFWAPAEAFRPITNEEVAPINPDAENKRVVVDLVTQTLTCFEGDQEVYFCRISSGLNPYGIEAAKYLTPLGNFPIWGKYLATHMAGGTAAQGWDLAGIGWVSLFFQNGQAVHSTWWHNNFGEEMSNGCVNAAPEDAKWVFRWTMPRVDYHPGNTTVQGYDGTTMISVIEA